MAMTAQTQTMVRCPCCGYRTLHERAGDDICSVCFWHDDGQDDAHADEVWGGPNKDLSLTKARENFRSFGAVHRDVLAHVRPPLPEEM
jgi:hypothetical protein